MKYLAQAILCAAAISLLHAAETPCVPIPTATLAASLQLPEAEGYYLATILPPGKNNRRIRLPREKLNTSIIAPVQASGESVCVLVELPFAPQALPQEISVWELEAPPERPFFSWDTLFYTPLAWFSTFGADRNDFMVRYRLFSRDELTGIWRLPLPEHPTTYLLGAIRRVKGTSAAGVSIRFAGDPWYSLGWIDTGWHYFLLPRDTIPDSEEIPYKIKVHMQK